MEYDKINNLLLSEDNESEKLYKFVTREYVRVNSLSNTYNECYWKIRRSSQCFHYNQKEREYLVFSFFSIIMKTLAASSNFPIKLIC